MKTRRLFLVGLSILTSACGAITSNEAAVAVYPPRQVRAECGERYVWLPFERTVIVTMSVGGCWSDWLAVPPAATRAEFRSDGVLDVQVVAASGEVSVHEAVSPVARIPALTRAAAVRYRNRQSRPVTVEIDLR